MRTEQETLADPTLAAAVAELTGLIRTPYPATPTPTPPSTRSALPSARAQPGHDC